MCTHKVRTSHFWGFEKVSRLMLKGKPEQYPQVPSSWTHPESILFLCTNKHPPSSTPLLPITASLRQIHILLDSLPCWASTCQTAAVAAFHRVHMQSAQMAPMAWHFLSSANVKHICPMGKLMGCFDEASSVGVEVSSACVRLHWWTSNKLKQCQQRTACGQMGV